MEMETTTLESGKETATLDSKAEERDILTNHEAKKSSDTSSMERREKIYVWLCGVLTLTPIMLIILVLLSLPTVFYALQGNSQSTVRIILWDKKYFLPYMLLRVYIDTL